MIPKNQKTATSTNQYEPAGTNPPAFKVAAYLPTSTTNQGHGYQQARTHQRSKQLHTYQPAPSRHVSPASTNQHEPAGTNPPAFKVAAYLPTSNQHQAATSTKQARITSKHEPTNDKKNITY